MFCDKFLKVLVVATTNTFILWSCSSQDKLAYELPQAMLPDVKMEYAKMCDKGKTLYELNCAKCHSTLTSSENIIPDFSQEQLEGYSMRESAEHSTAMPENLVSEEDLVLIKIFLSYKKKNN